MADVAERAGVSKMTVSRVLAGRSVSQATREKVQKVIDELGYVADAAAGALSSGRSEFVAVLVPSLSSSNFSDTVRGLNAAFSPHGLQLLLGDTDYRLEQEELLVRSMLRHQPRCVALTGSRHTEATRTLLQRRYPGRRDVGPACRSDRHRGGLFERRGRARDGSAPACEGLSANRLHCRSE